MTQPGQDITHTFAELERLIGQPLPPRAWTRAWWANVRGPKHPQANAWLCAGWEVVDADRLARTVTFTRTAGR